MSSPPTESTRVDLRAIERELTGLWQSAAESAEAGHTAPVTRTCLVNLIVLVSDRASARLATAAIDRLTAVYPNRAIVAVALPEPEDGAPPAEEPPPLLDAWVQAHCMLPAPGRPQVCGEQITVEAHGAAGTHIPGVVLPLLVPDVPVALWLPHGAPGAYPLAARFVDVADRLVVDSATFDAPERCLAELAGLIDADTSVSDLAWARLTSWRELVAQFFDAPGLRQHLAEVEALRLGVPVHGDDPPDRAVALLLAGWLAHRLGWTAAGAGEVAELRQADGRAVRLEIAPVPPAADRDERLAEVTILCSRARFAVTRVAGTDAVVTRAEAEGMWPIQRTMRMERLETAALLAGELQLLGRDAGFEGALRIAAALAG